MPKSHSLSEIKRKVQEIEQQSRSVTPSLKERLDDTLRRFKQSKVWDDPKYEFYLKLAEAL